MNIQIFENDESSSDEEDNDNENNNQIKQKEDDSGRTDDPVRMYLKEMGNVELLSRVGEIEIAKELKVEKIRRQTPFRKALYLWNPYLTFIMIILIPKSNLEILLI